MGTIAYIQFYNAFIQFGYWGNATNERYWAYNKLCEKYDPRNCNGSWGDGFNRWINGWVVAADDSEANPSTNDTDLIAGYEPDETITIKCRKICYHLTVVC